MVEIILTVGLLIIQILLYHFVKRRWVLLILPVLFFILLGVPNLFHTYEGVPATENMKINMVRMLLESLYVLVLLAPFIFAFIKKVGWRIVVVVLLALIVPISFGAGTNVYKYGGLLYSVKVRHYDDIPKSQCRDITEPYVQFEFKFRDRYADTDDPSKPADTTRSQPSTTTQPSRI